VWPEESDANVRHYLPELRVRATGQ
jgi:hypothetical protein